MEGNDRNKELAGIINEGTYQNKKIIAQGIIGEDGVKELTLKTSPLIIIPLNTFGWNVEDFKDEDILVGLEVFVDQYVYVLKGDAKYEQLSKLRDDNVYKLPNYKFSDYAIEDFDNISKEANVIYTMLSKFYEKKNNDDSITTPGERAPIDNQVQNNPNLNESYNIRKFIRKILK